MADIALGSVEKIVRVGLVTKKAVETVRQNEVECQEIQELVTTLMDILPLLQETAVMKHPAMHRALVGLERTLNRALKLITDCQAKRNMAWRDLGSGDMSRKLRNKVHDDILLRTVPGTFATHHWARHHDFDKCYPIPICRCSSSSAHTATGPPSSLERAISGDGTKERQLINLSWC
ncbi:hypothetical protein BS78_05G233300 [Paspalum vaginatum]|nr:hypothetical protein BS78_05G233300 [Paspalum vaginatum]